MMSFSSDCAIAGAFGVKAAAALASPPTTIARRLLYLFVFEYLVIIFPQMLLFDF
jgi:hypothetical protein